MTLLLADSDGNEENDFHHGDSDGVVMATVW